MSKTSQKQEKEDRLHAVAHRLWRLGASQHQWIPAAGNQQQGAPVSWAKCVLGFPGLVVSSLVLLCSKKCRPVLPWLKGYTSRALSSCVRRRSSVARSLGLAGTSWPRSLHLLGKHTLPLAGSGWPQWHGQRPSSGEKFGISLKIVLRPSSTPNKRSVFSPVKST